MEIKFPEFLEATANTINEHCPGEVVLFTDITMLDLDIDSLAVGSFYNNTIEVAHDGNCSKWHFQWTAGLGVRCGQDTSLV